MKRTFGTLKLRGQTPAQQPQGGVGAIIGGIAAYAGASAGTAAAIGTAVNIAVAAASIAVSYSQAKKSASAQKRALLESLQRNSVRNFRQPLVARRIIYGRSRVAGPIIFAHNRAKFSACLLIAFASHECEEIESLYIVQDEIEPAAGLVPGKYRFATSIWTYLGAPAQNIGTIMRTAVQPAFSTFAGIPSVISTDDKFEGICAAYMITSAFSAYFEGQNPDLSAVIKGRKVYDPRSTSTAYSANPALCAADYLVNFMGFPFASIDLDTLIASADICDEDVDLKAGGFENRYECNGVITSDMEHREVLEVIGISMAGRIRYSSGTWFIEAGAPKSTNAYEFTEAMVLDSYEISFERPDRSLPNAVRGNFVDRAEWQPASFPSYEDAAAIAAEDGTNWLDLELLMTTSPSMAQRIARIELGRARARRSLSIPLDLRGMTARPGDVVRYSAESLGIDGFFEVDAVTFAAGGENGLTLGTRLDLIDYDSSIFEWDEDTDEADMVRGSVELNSIRHRYIYDPTVLETITDTTASFDASYGFAWINPETSDVELQSVTVNLVVRVTSEDPDEIDPDDVQDVTRSIVVAGGGQSTSLDVDATYPGDYEYKEHEIITATVQAKFANNTTSPLISVTEI